MQIQRHWIEDSIIGEKGDKGDQGIQGPAGPGSSSNLNRVQLADTDGRFKDAPALMDDTGKLTHVSSSGVFSIEGTLSVVNSLVRLIAAAATNSVILTTSYDIATGTIIFPGDATIHGDLVLNGAVNITVPTGKTVYLDGSLKTTTASTITVSGGGSLVIRYISNTNSLGATGSVFFEDAFNQATITGAVFQSSKTKSSWKQALKRVQVGEGLTSTYTEANATNKIELQGALTAQAQQAFVKKADGSFGFEFVGLNRKVYVADSAVSFRTALQDPYTNKTIFWAGASSFDFSSMSGSLAYMPGDALNANTRINVYGNNKVFLPGPSFTFSGTFYSSCASTGTVDFRDSAVTGPCTFDNSSGTLTLNIATLLSGGVTPTVLSAGTSILVYFEGYSSEGAIGADVGSIPANWNWAKFNTVVPDNAQDVGNGRLRDMPAKTIKANPQASSSTPEDITAGDLRALLAEGAAVGTFLSDDGSFKEPPGLGHRVLAVHNDATYREACSDPTITMGFVVQPFKIADGAVTVVGQTSFYGEQIELPSEATHQINWNGSDTGNSLRFYNTVVGDTADNRTLQVSRHLDIYFSTFVRPTNLTGKTYVVCTTDGANPGRVSINKSFFGQPNNDGVIELVNDLSNPVEPIAIGGGNAGIVRLSYKWLDTAMLLNSHTEQEVSGAVNWYGANTWKSYADFQKGLKISSASDEFAGLSSSIALHDDAVVHTINTGASLTFKVGSSSSDNSSKVVLGPTSALIGYSAVGLVNLSTTQMGSGLWVAEIKDPASIANTISKIEQTLTETRISRGGTSLIFDGTSARLLSGLDISLQTTVSLSANAADVSLTSTSGVFGITSAGAFEVSAPKYLFGGEISGNSSVYHFVDGDVALASVNIDVDADSVLMWDSTVGTIVRRTVADLIPDATKFVTTDTDQSGLSGIKSWDGAHTFGSTVSVSGDLTLTTGADASPTKILGLNGSNVVVNIDTSYFGFAEWGNVTGDIETQTDLVNKFNTKLDSSDDRLEAFTNQITSGVVYGLSFSKVNSTDVSIGAGLGYSVDRTDPTSVGLAPVYVEVTTPITHTITATDGLVLLYLTPAGSVVEYTSKDNSRKYKGLIKVGQVFMVAGAIDEVVTNKNSAFAPGAIAMDMAAAIGTIRSQADISLSAVDTTIAQTDGYLLSVGTNFETDIHDANKVVIPSDSSVGINMFTPTDITAEGLSVDTTQQYSGGSLIALPNDKWAVWRVYQSVNKKIYVSYPQTQYSTETDALSAYSRGVDVFTNHPKIADRSDAIYLGAIIARGQVVDFSTATWLPADVFGLVGGGAGAANTYWGAIFGDIANQTDVNLHNVTTNGNTTTNDVVIGEVFIGSNKVSGLLADGGDGSLLITSDNLTIHADTLVDITADARLPDVGSLSFAAITEAGTVSKRLAVSTTSKLMVADIDYSEIQNAPNLGLYLHKTTTDGQTVVSTVNWSDTQTFAKGLSITGSILPAGSPAIRMASGSYVGTDNATGTLTLMAGDSSSTTQSYLALSSTAVLKAVNGSRVGSSITVGIGTLNLSAEDSQTAAIYGGLAVSSTQTVLNQVSFGSVSISNASTSLTSTSGKVLLTASTAVEYSAGTYHKWQGGITGSTAIYQFKGSVAIDGIGTSTPVKLLGVDADGVLVEEGGDILGDYLHKTTTTGQAVASTVTWAEEQTFSKGLIVSGNNGSSVAITLPASGLIAPSSAGSVIGLTSGSALTDTYSYAKLGSTESVIYYGNGDNANPNAKINMDAAEASIVYNNDTQSVKLLLQDNGFGLTDVDNGSSIVYSGATGTYTAGAHSFVSASGDYSFSNVPSSATSVAVYAENASGKLVKVDAQPIVRSFVSDKISWVKAGLSNNAYELMTTSSAFGTAPGESSPRFTGTAISYEMELLNIVIQSISANALTMEFVIEEMPVDTTWAIGAGTVVHTETILSNASLTATNYSREISLADIALPANKNLFAYMKVTSGVYAVQDVEITVFLKGIRN